jgi:hypothetical protein
MESSVKALIVFGTLVLTYGFLLGVPMARVRMSAPAAPRHLVTTHLEALMAGPALLGLAVAAGFSTLNDVVEGFAAWFVIAGVLGSVTGGTVNWRMNTGDPFAVRSPGFLLQAIGGPLMLLGGLLLSVGVLMGL